MQEFIVQVKITVGSLKSAPIKEREVWWEIEEILQNYLSDCYESVEVIDVTGQP